MSKFKTAVSEFTATVQNIWANAREFVDAVCLGVTSAYSFYEAMHHIKNNWYRALLFASVVIGLQALVLFVRHFNKPVVVSKK